MPNKKGGKKYKQGKKNDATALKKELVLAEEEQEYGMVVKCFGDGRFQILCNDNVERLGVMRGSMRKRMWISTNSLVLVSGREFETRGNKVDIIHCYQCYDDVRSLIRLQELSVAIQNAMLGIMTKMEEETTDVIDFVDDDNGAFSIDMI